MSMMNNGGFRTIQFSHPELKCPWSLIDRSTLSSVQGSRLYICECVRASLAWVFFPNARAGHGSQVREASPGRCGMCAHPRLATDPTKRELFTKQADQYKTLADSVQLTMDLFGSGVAAFLGHKTQEPFPQEKSTYGDPTAIIRKVNDITDGK